MVSRANCKKDKIYIVEYRERRPDGRVDSLVTFVGSSLETVEEFLKNNTDYAPRNCLWYWAVYPEIIDQDPIREFENAPDEIWYYSWDGSRLESQPI